MSFAPELVAVVADNQDMARTLFRSGYSIRPALVRPLPAVLWDEMNRFLDANLVSLNKGVIQRHADASDGRLPACRAGCCHCCFQTIEVTSVELVRLALSIGPEERPSVLARAGTTAKRVAPLDKPQRYAAAIPCPMLQDRHCSRYEARPVACRTYWSLSRTACDSDWRHRRRSGRSGVPLLAHGLLGGEMMMTGFAAAFQAAGFEVVRVELAAGLARLLSLPGLVLCAAWLRGERVFEGLPEWRGAGEYAHVVGEMAQKWGKVVP
jgi:uncharacterized protein